MRARQTRLALLIAVLCAWNLWLFLGVHWRRPASVHAVWGGSDTRLALALAAGRFFSLILYGVSARDPVTFGLAIALIAMIAFIACLVPARRAIRVDPVTALRTE